MFLKKYVNDLYYEEILENYKEEDNNSDNDIFNLIDSMYDEEDK